MDLIARFPGLLMQALGGFAPALLVILGVAVVGALWLGVLVTYWRREDRREAVRQAAKYAPRRENGRWLDR